MPMTDQAKTVSQWMDQPDSNKPSVIRWHSDSVVGDWPIDGINITAQWKFLATASLRFAPEGMRFWKPSPTFAAESCRTGKKNSGLN